MPKGFAAAAGLTPPSIVCNGMALWAQAPALDVRAAACSNAAAARKMTDAGLRQLSSFSPPHPHRPHRNGEEGRGAEGVQGEEGRAREEEVM